MGQMFSTNWKPEDTQSATDSDANCTPKVCRVLDVDPRSPTVHINRTPIEVKCTPKGTNGMKKGSENESPLSSSTVNKDKPRSLHQRIIDKKRLEDTTNDAQTQ